jgi:predicted ATPase
VTTAGELATKRLNWPRSHQAFGEFSWIYRNHLKPPAQPLRYLFQSFSEALARVARICPQLLVLEDLHWADESMLALLTYLANRIVQLGAVIIGTYRGGDSDDNPVLVRTLEELIRLGIRPLKLGGLSKDAVAQVLRGLSQRETAENLVSAIVEESQGYPFFVEEVYRHLVEEGKVFDTDGELRADIKIDEIDVPENVRLIISAANWSGSTRMKSARWRLPR